MKNSILTISLLVLCRVAIGQTVLYSENFSGQDGKGATGVSGTPSTQIDLSGVNWTIDVSATSLTATNDFFRVQNGRLDARDVDGQAIWLSPSIDISALTNATLTLDASDSGNDRLEDDDTLTTQYRIDGGIWTNANTNGFLINDFGNVVVSQDNLNGSTLELRILVNNNDNNERHRVDNILVTDGTTTAYSENFSGQNGKGASVIVIPNPPTIDTTGVNWTIDVSATTLTQPSDYLRVIGNRFEARDVDGAAIWFSPIIDISSVTNVTFSIDAFHPGTNRFEDSDTLTTDYRVDGGPWINAVNNGALSNDFVSVIISQDNISGNTLELRITFLNNNGNERHRIDNIEVFETPLSYVYDNAWSPRDPNGIASSSSTISVVNGDATISENTNCDTFMVEAGASVTIDPGTTINNSGDFTLESTSTSYSSLIRNGTITGDIQYNRHINQAAASGTTTNANDLISAPLTGETFGNFRAGNPNIFSGTLGGNLAFLFGPFDSTTDNYIIYETTDDSSILNAGVGYRTGSTDNDTYTYSGTAENGVVTANVSNTGATNWNLVGNPYPSYLSAEAFLNDTSNAALLDVNAFGIYGYDGSALDGWTIVNLANVSPSTVIAPGQGFFVAANAVGTINFTPDMRTTGSSDDFILGRSNNNTLTYLKLSLNSTNNSYYTDFYFNANSSTGLDIGYDAVIWNNTIPSFGIYSHLVTDNQNKPIALQSLNTSDINSTTIALGVEANQGESVQFSILENTLPSNTQVFLEDRQLATLTLLNTSNYSLTPQTNLNGTGRFFLHFQSNTLNLDEVNPLDAIKISAIPSAKQILIQGNFESDTSLQLFDVNGRNISSKELQMNVSAQYLNFTSLASGVYIVKINNVRGSITKKIVF